MATIPEEPPRARTTLRERVFEAGGRHLLLIFIALALCAIAAVLLHAALFGPVSEDSARSEFVVKPGQSLDEISTELEDQGYVKYGFVLRFAYAATRGDADIRPGGYEISRSMDAWTLAKTLSEAPYLAWITIPDGLRKEEIAELLAVDLNWTPSKEAEWLLAASTSSALADGIYYPDTYLIPSDQPPAQVAARLRGRFEEVFASSSAEAAKEGLSWPEVVTLASLVEREAAKNDKALIAGILWNRIHKHMLLQVDATLQYIEGTEGNWWPAPNPDDKGVDSPFNTYKYAGLPPHPIANPSIASIDAVLHPTKTSCLYYLHDSRGIIHCSPTYAGQKANVARYLK
jgi:UPF0755 protein